MPGARDVDEDYDNGPQSPIAKGLDGARNEASIDDHRPLNSILIQLADPQVARQGPPNAFF